MLDFFKTLIRKESVKKPIVIRFEEIPALIDQKKNEAGARLLSETEAERATIRAAAVRLHEVIHAMLAAQFSDEIHPKLKSIAQKSLPLFTKAIETACEKTLPESPEEFYNSAAELLKTSINAMNQQGKYLRVVFPEEMKAVSSCVADIGRAINTMNEPVGEFRAAIAQIAEAEKIHGALADIDLDVKKSMEKEERMIRRMQEINERIDGCERALADLEREKNGPELKRKEDEIVSLRKERDLTMHRYSTLSMTASHVLRKAEKVARRQQKQTDERAIARAIALLSDHTIPDTKGIDDVLSAAFTPAQRMIDAGEIALKNKEERTLFASPTEASRQIRMLCSEYSRQAAAYDSAELVYMSDPVIARHGEAARERQSHFTILSKEKLAHAELLQWRDGLVKDIPSLREELKKRWGLILSGSDVQIHFPDS
jgi:hypothetical protein